MLCAHLTYRQVIEVSGPDRLAFLQGLLTQDLHLLESQPAVYTLRLNRMGRILSDAWIIAKDDNTWWMDTENAEAIAQDLSTKKLRYRVSFDVTDVPVYVVWQADPPVHAIRDTRHADLGWRVYGHLDSPGVVSTHDYRRHTLSLGVPDGSLDFEIGRAMPLPWGCEHAIGWDKGCYVGQEPVARSRYQGVVRQHIVPVVMDAESGWTIDADSIIYDESKILKGRLVSRFQNQGLALVSTDVADRPLKVRLSTPNT